MKDFVIPLAPEALLKESGGRYAVTTMLKLSKMSQKDVLGLLDEYYELDNCPTDIIEPNRFDPLFHMLREYSSLSSEGRSTLFQTLCRGMKNVGVSARRLLSGADLTSIECRKHCNAMKMYAFLIHWQLNKEEKAAEPQTTKSRSKKKNTSNDLFWTNVQREKVLSVFLEILELQLGVLWKSEYPEEDFLNIFNKTVTQFYETPANIKCKALAQCLQAMVACLVRQYGQSVSLVPSFTHLLHRHEHVILPLSELCTVLSEDTRSASFVGEMLQELSGENNASSGAKNVAVFLSEVAHRLPRQTLKYISLLIGHLGNESHQIRNGIVQVLGHLIAKGFNQEEDDGELERTKQRDALLDVLLERVHDVASYTRSKALQTWASLIEQRAVPKDMIPTLAETAVARLEDKAVQVRKYAILLLTSLLQYNPYLGQLKLSEFEKNCAAAKEKLAALQKRDSPKKNEEEKSNESENEGEEKMDTVDEDEEEKEANEEEKDDFDIRDTDEYKSSAVLVQYYTDGTAFITTIHNAFPTICSLFGKTATDVQEAINFVVVATEFNIEAAPLALSKLLALIWSRDAAVKDSVIAAYHRLYLVPPAPIRDNEKAEAMFVAQNLTTIVGNASNTELSSFQELIKSFMLTNKLSDTTEKCLWAMFTQKIENVTEEQSRNALIVLAFMGTARPDIIFKQFQLILSHGFGDRWMEDELIAKYSCIALQQLGKRRSLDKSDPPMKFQQSHALFQKLSNVVTGDSASLSKWFCAAEQAINTIYLLSEHPDAVCGDIIKALYERISNPSAGTEVSVASLCKLIFSVGHIALQQLVWLDDVQVELRRRRDVKEKMAEENGSKRTAAAAEAIEEELGLSAASEETESEFLQLVAEKELVLSNMLGAFAPLIVAVCSNKEGRFSNPTLRSAATISLTKFMCVSSEFCEKNLRLLFTILERAEESEIRSDVMIALSDLCSRHHNLVAPWTSNMFARLQDQSSSVRKNALMVLSHLILNEIIKPKGQISEIAMCIEDDDSQISDLARLFFHELANKTNAVYNHIPDIISNMSSSDTVSSEAFRRLMKYLFSFITKERQAESLIDKLCARFRCCTSTEQSADIAFCLTLLNYSERAIKKVSENFKTYQSLLVHDSVFTMFINVIKKAKNFSKVEIRPIVEELEERIIAAHNGEDKENSQNEREEGKAVAPLAVRSSSRRPRAKKTVPRRSSRRKQAHDSSDEEEEVDMQLDSDTEIDLL